MNMMNFLNQNLRMTSKRLQITLIQAIHPIIKIQTEMQ